MRKSAISCVKDMLGILDWMTEAGYLTEPDANGCSVQFQINTLAGAVQIDLKTIKGLFEEKENHEKATDN